MKRQLIIALLSTLLTGFLYIETDSTPKISWETLKNIEWELVDGNYRAEFPGEIKELDGKTVEIQGFMFPLGLGSDNSKEFLISPNPVSECYFCIPGSNDMLVMAYAEDSIEFQFDAVLLEGTFQLVPDDVYGMVYQIRDVKLKKVL